MPLSFTAQSYHKRYLYQRIVAVLAGIIRAAQAEDANPDRVLGDAIIAVRALREEWQ